ncbi:MAG: hypothetical protein WC867_05535 [Candidatus Pacearchaeota archaeon]|jgi:hypothetical protein
MAKKVIKKSENKSKIISLTDKTEGSIAIFALLLILISSIYDYKVSLVIAIVFIILLAIYKFIKE